MKREDRRAGEVVAMLYNINRDTSSDPRGLEWRDFFPEWAEEVEQDEEEMFQTMLLLSKSTEGLTS